MIDIGTTNVIKIKMLCMLSLFFNKGCYFYTDLTKIKSTIFVLQLR